MNFTVSYRNQTVLSLYKPKKKFFFQMRPAQLSQRSHILFVVPKKVLFWFSRESEMGSHYAILMGTTGLFKQGSVGLIN